MNPPLEFEWIEPWQLIEDAAIALSLLAELEKELSPTHSLFQRAIKALARRGDCDDVLFLTKDDDRPLAVVHLTWRGREEPDPTWPHTEFVSDWSDWSVRGREA